MDTQQFINEILNKHYTERAKAKEEKIAKQQDEKAENSPIGKPRLEICKSCEHYNHTYRVCKECHCIMPVKVILPFVKCPVGKW